ncbi:MAG: glycosyltransferase family 2 protein [Acidimicrobiia bacterium]|nr:glycosyltransferase family 2 protein [Acidimicrobiia bacterium]
MTATVAPSTEEIADVDVVIVAYRSGAAITQCLAGARAISGVGRVIVVDHGGDDSWALAARAGALVIGNAANPGFGAGQNRGFAHGAAPYVLVLNPDAVPKPDAITAGIRYLDEHSDVAVVQGVVRDATTGAPERSQGRELGVLHLFGRALGARRLLRIAPIRWLATKVALLQDHVERVPLAPVRVDALAATAWLARRDALSRVGGFDEQYFLYGEDLDLCRRLRRAGWELVALPDEWAIHGQGGSAASSFERELTWWAGTLRFASQWWSTPKRVGACMAAVVRAIGLTAQRPRSVRRIWHGTIGAARPAR